ncbi:MAG: class I SAM-dependent methyltransferase [Fibromonadaceae bacterium]|jgi:23S rRNA (cytosine1962-C5)-methyltransferase|nr:class I SAM-dependent methyltransferase [Fibromonadaceae bacterium]
MHTANLSGSPTAYRLFNGAASGLDGVAIDKYNAHYQIQFFNKNLIEREKELVQMLKNDFSPEFIAVKYRFINNSQIKAVFGNNSKTIVEEYGCKFHVDLMDTLNPGLFLDMRDARHNFALHCKEKEMLNLFAYTCSFSVHARKNGAIKAVNVDISKKNLRRGKENYLLNGIEPKQGEFFCGSSEEYIDWCIKKGKRFGAIVIDPPSFAKNGKKTFSVATDYENLATKAASLLESSGALFLATNYSEWSNETLRKTAQNAFARNGKKCKILAEGTQGIDFPGTGESKESSMVYLLLLSTSDTTPSQLQLCGASQAE